MPLTSKHRSALYEALAPLAGEEAVDAMLSDHPSSEADAPVTKDFLRAELSGIRVEMADFRAEVRGELADVRAELADFRAEMADFRAGLSDFRAELRGELKAHTVWTVGAVTTILAAVVTINELLH